MAALCRAAGWAVWRAAAILLKSEYAGALASTLDISAIVMIWHETDGSQAKLRRAQDRLVESGFRLQPIRPSGTAKILWAFRSTFPRMSRQG